MYVCIYYIIFWSTKNAYKYIWSTVSVNGVRLRVVFRISVILCLLLMHGVDHRRKFNFSPMAQSSVLE